MSLLRFKFEQLFQDIIPEILNQNLQVLHI